MQPPMGYGQPYGATLPSSFASPMAFPPPPGEEEEEESDSIGKPKAVGMSPAAQRTVRLVTVLTVTAVIIGAMSIGLVMGYSSLRNFQEDEEGTDETSGPHHTEKCDCKKPATCPNILNHTVPDSHPSSNSTT
ncbi:uncharacterized protein LOC135376128 [Ornithodoros turicata]|uniref:uncharacterized protein LOC135375807 n=1 Tax=Ornithodoros turicata TaxID=34597 RepID=UPI0031398C88